MGGAIRGIRARSRTPGREARQSEGGASFFAEKIENPFEEVLSFYENIVVHLRVVYVIYRRVWDVGVDGDSLFHPQQILRELVIAFCYNTVGFNAASM